jgi:hypothetical protein
MAVVWSKQRGYRGLTRVPWLMSLVIVTPGVTVTELPLESENTSEQAPAPTAVERRGIRGRH